MVYRGKPLHTGTIVRLQCVTTRSKRTVYNGVPWYTMVHHGVPWYTMDYHGIPRYTMVHHDKPWYSGVMVYLPWYTAVQQRCVITWSYHDIPWRTPRCTTYVFSIHVAAVLTGWRTRRTVIDRNISVELEWNFRLISQFFSRTSCFFECRYLINSKRHITAHMT